MSKHRLPRRRGKRVTVADLTLRHIMEEQREAERFTHRAVEAMRAALREHQAVSA